jgi:hypothetical protein
MVIADYGIGRGWHQEALTDYAAKLLHSYSVFWGMTRFIEPSKLWSCSVNNIVGRYIHALLYTFPLFRLNANCPSVNTDYTELVSVRVLFTDDIDYWTNVS